MFLLGDACGSTENIRVVSYIELSLEIQELVFHEASLMMIELSVVNGLENNLWLHLAHDSQQEESFCIREDPSISGLLKHFIWYRNYIH